MPLSARYTNDSAVLLYVAHAVPMSDWKGKPWQAPARSLVLYCPQGQWRYAVYNDAGVMDGGLSDIGPSDSPEEAQAALLARVRADTGLNYQVKWRAVEPQWWTADLVVLES